MSDDIKLNIDSFKSNGIKRCIDCGIPITPDNDSGWEVFVTGNTTQPICAWCDVIRGEKMTGAKLEDSDEESDQHHN